MTETPAQPHFVDLYTGQLFFLYPLPEYKDGVWEIPMESWKGIIGQDFQESRHWQVEEEQCSKS